MKTPTPKTIARQANTKKLHFGDCLWLSAAIRAAGAPGPPAHDQEKENEASTTGVRGSG